MTWSHVVANGGGPYELRLVIAGYPREWITDGLTAGTVTAGSGTDRTRCRGLLRRGLQKSERARFAEGLPDQSGMTATIVDIDEQATAEFTAVPTWRAWLTTTVDTDDATFVYAGGASDLNTSYLHIGTEVVKLTMELSYQRGQWDTIAQGHWVQRGDTVLAPELTDVPVMMTGRRWMLYAHGPTELGLSSEGTLVARGRVAAEPTERDCTWSIRLDPQVSVFDQEIVQPLAAPLHITGIYYPWDAPFVLTLREATGPGLWDATINTAADLVTIELSGFFESQEAFVNALNAALETELASASVEGDVYAKIDDGRWELYYAPGATEYFMLVSASNPVDGQLDNTTLDKVTTTGEIEIASFVENGFEFRFRWLPYVDRIPEEDLRGFPRNNALTSPYQSVTETADNPRNRLYLREAPYLQAGDHITIRDESETVAELRTHQHEILAVDTDTGAVDVGNGLMAAAWSRGSGPTIRAYGHALEAISLAGFRDQLVANGPLRGNLGDTPLLDGDDLASWTTEVDIAADGRAPLTKRLYAFPKRVQLKDVLAHEMRNLGVYAYTDADEKLAVRGIVPTLETDPTITEIETNYRVVDDGFGYIDSVADGVINVAELKTGYNVESGAFEGDTFIVPNAISISRLAGRKRTLEIAPKVGLAPGVRWSREDAIAVGIIPISYFGERYHVITIDVTLHLFDLRVGDGVSFDIPQLPWQGSRGVAGVGTVVGYSWDFEAGKGSLEIMVRDTANIAGYVPSGRIASQSLVGGTTYDITLTATHYAPTGTTDASLFAAGQRVRVWRFDSNSSAEVLGDVVSVTANVIRVTFDGAWTPGAFTWNLIATEHDDILANASTYGQLDYAFVADADRNLSNDEPARTVSS